MSTKLQDSQDTSPQSYSQRELDLMDTETLLALYKQTGDQALKSPLVLRYVGLVKSIALQITGVYSSFAQVDDIVNEGVIALMTALDKYQPEIGTKFETYISKRIRGMIIDLARQQDWLPRSVRKRSKEIDQAVSELYSTLGRFPSDEEICNKLGISQTKYRADLVNLDLSNVMSLEALFESRDRGGPGLNFPCSSYEDQPDQTLQDLEFKEQLAQGIGQLRDNEQMVLSLYYEKELNMREIAQVMDISEPRVSQIHSRAIQKLRFFLEQYLKSGV